MHDRSPFKGGCSQLFHSTSESFVEARNIRDGSILKTERWVLHDFPDAEAATEGKCVAASRCVRKNDFT